MNIQTPHSPTPSPPFHSHTHTRLTSECDDGPKEDPPNTCPWIYSQHTTFWEAWTAAIHMVPRHVTLGNTPVCQKNQKMSFIVISGRIVGSSLTFKNNITWILEGPPLHVWVIDLDVHAVPPARIDGVCKYVYVNVCIYT